MNEQNSTPLVQRGVMTDVFNLMPNLVLDLHGIITIVTRVHRITDDEVILVTVTSAHTTSGEVTIPMSWGSGAQVRVIGLAVNGEPENIDLFNS